jgi:hypothetical protein
LGHATPSSKQLRETEREPQRLTLCLTTRLCQLLMIEAAELDLTGEEG